MSFTHGKPPNRGYGKPTSPHYRSAGDRYGHQSRNYGESINKRENLSRSEDICAEPPLWLDAYLENFKKKLITELTDNIIKEFDNSYKNNVERQRYRSSYFALKQRFSKLQAARNGDESHKKKMREQYTHDTNNTGYKLEERNSHKSYHNYTRNERNGNRNEHFDECASALPNVSSSKVANEDEKDIVKGTLTLEELENIVTETIDITGITPTMFINKANDYEKTLSGQTNSSEKVLDEFVIEKNAAKEIENEVQDNIESSSNQTNIVEIPNKLVMEEGVVRNIKSETLNDVESSSKQTTTPTEVPDECLTENNQYSLIKIFELLREVQLDEETSLLTSQHTTGDASIDEICNKKNQITLNKLTQEDFKVIEKIKECEMDTLEKQQKAVNFFFDRAIDEPENAVVYARLCKKIFSEHGCIKSFCKILMARYNAELMRHKKIMKEIQAESVEMESDKFMGALLFMGENYNQEVLTNADMEQYLNYFLQNDSKSNLKYLCHILRLIGKSFESREKNVALYMNHLIEFRDMGGIDEKLTTLINSLVKLISNDWESSASDASSGITEFEDAPNE